jgi:meso-butanediol dehydrogenase / (S,S)-butanediol dehydrogenase / diacetyl reductase
MARAIYSKSVTEVRSMSLKNSVVIVTGATSGIGKAISMYFAQLGARLMIVGRDRMRGEAVLIELKKLGADAEFIAADITTSGAAEMIASSTSRRFGVIDVLVNNAGIMFRGNCTTCTDEEWNQTIATNVTSVFRMSRAVLPFMQQQKSGAIVNIASDWALVGARNALAYGASKGAVAQITRSMALDHAHDGIRVNAVCPGDTDTAMLDGAIGSSDRAKGLAELGSAIPMGRVANPGEVARAVAYLASDDSSFTTGIMLPVDGGNSAQ